MKKIIAAGMGLLMVACGANKAAAPVEVHWEPGTGVDEATGKAVERFTITNNTGEELAQGWEMWFNQTRTIEELPGAQVKLEEGLGNIVKMMPTEGWEPLGKGETRVVEIATGYEFKKDYDAPEGVFMVIPGRGAVDVALSFDSLPRPERVPRVVAAGPMGQTDILPHPKEVLEIDVAEGAEASVEIGKQVVVEAAEGFEGEARLLKEKLAAMGITAGTEGTKIRLEKEEGLQAEGYKLAIGAGEVKIGATTGAGAFYGAQTLVDMLKGEKIPAVLRDVVVEDWPDFAFRGQHVDVARNYTTKENVFRLVDLFASYKLNVLHFHFSDDEGWRIEIPGLPELTQIGARRGYTVDEMDMLLPAYGGGHDPEKGAGSGYLTRADFIELLKYAKERHVTVIPEIESPGHARAAKVAMTARYRNFMAAGDEEAAREYLLEDFEDASVYTSAQYYHDNVMNVALPSTYRFMEKVIDEIVAMYADAGAELGVVHVGGDEVPRGSWTGSPVAAKFMEANGLEDVTALGEYYILRVNDLLKARGLKMAGWQELVEGRSAEFREAVKGNLAYVNCWSTNGRSAEVPYTLANLGYPVVLSNVGNLYFDLAYENAVDEPGLSWGGYVDEKAVFAMQPYNIYASLRRDREGNALDVYGAGRGLEALTEEGRANIVGIQGQLWAETFRNFDMVTRSLFPKMMGFIERAWNATPDWSEAGSAQGEREAFERDYGAFEAEVFGREIPWLKEQGLVVRER